MAETEKVVGYGDMIMTAVTRYNQVVSHFITATGLDKRTSNEFKVDNRTVQWLTKFDEGEYFITKTSFHHDKDIIKEANIEQTFLRIADGRVEGERIIYLLYVDTKEGGYCV